MKIKGLTLSELLITIIISGIFSLFVGSILFYNATFQKRGKTETELLDLLRFAELKIKLELRSANSLSIPNVTTLSYTLPSGQTRTFMLEDNKLVLKNGNANSTRVMLELARDVTNLEFKYEGVQNNAVKTQLSITKKIDNITNATISSTHTFIVHCRNIFKRL